jgi:hypothetical protein
MGRDIGRLAERQAALNRSVAANWDLFAEHRERVTALVCGAAPPPPAVACILGAGNCNDLDLPRLQASFAEVHLVDIDRDAVADGVRRQLGERTTLRIHAADVTGIADRLDRWTAIEPDQAEIDRCIVATGAEPHVGIDPESCHVVLSAGILSQVAGTAVRILGPDHPRAVEIALAIRDAHLSLVVDLLGPGGTGIVVTDVASTESSHALRSRADASPALLDDVLREGALPGTDPLGIERSLAELGTTDLGRHGPWLWRLTPSRTQLVWAASFRPGG